MQNIGQRTKKDTANFLYHLLQLTIKSYSFQVLLKMLKIRKSNPEKCFKKQNVFRSF